MNDFVLELQQIMPKLQLLTMNFPKLKLVWSPGAHYTSELFHVSKTFLYAFNLMVKSLIIQIIFHYKLQELKRGKPQPNPEEALSIMKEATGLSVSKYNPITHSLLSKMPGIDSRNVYTILNHCNSLVDLAKMTESELTEVLGNSQNAKALYAGLHSRILFENSESNQGSSGKSKPSVQAGPSKSSTTSNFRVGVKDRGRRGKR